MAHGTEYDWVLLTTWTRPIEALILPLFFALSGFLVAGSLERCRTLISFLGLRLIRLIPALAVETVLCAVIIGTIFTTLPLHDYFLDPSFRSYCLNMFGNIHYYLPGVFEGNPAPRTVNGQLWTLPYEMICYGMISGLAFIRVVRRSSLFLPVLVALNVALLVYELTKPIQVHFAIMTGLELVQCFLYGIAFYLYRAKIVWSGRIALACLAVTLILLSPQFQLWGDYVAPAFATYFTVYVGLLQPRRLRFIASGDYSYGIFLYGYPMQQTVAASTGTWGQHSYINFALAMPLTMIVAMFSWWCVEKPALKLRPRLIRFEDRFVALRGKFPWMGALLPLPLPHRGRSSLEPAVQKAA